MAYDPQADVDMANANEAQRQMFARNPVSAAAKAPPADQTYGDPASGAQISNPGGSPPPVSGGGFDPLGAVNNFVRPGSTSAQSYRESSGVADTALAPRRGPAAQADYSHEGQAGGDTKFGVITAAAAKAQPKQTSFTNADIPTGGAAPQGMTTEQANDYYGAQNRVMNAAQQQRLGQREADAADQASRPGYRDVEMAKSAARVAEFHRKNPMISGEQQGAGYEEQVKDLATASQGAQANATGLIARESAPRTNLQPQNLVQQAQEANEAANRSRKVGAEAGLTQAETGLAGTKQQLGQQAVRQGEINESIQKHMAMLQKEALQAGPAGQAAQDSLALYQKAMTGKGGPLTEEDKLKVYGDMVSRATAMGGPDAYKTLPNYSEFSASLNPNAKSKYTEGQTGTIDGRRVKIVNGQPVPI